LKKENRKERLSARNHERHEDTGQKIRLSKKKTQVKKERKGERVGTATWGALRAGGGGKAPGGKKGEVEWFEMK